MKRDFNSLALRISEKIYGQLLRAYPRAHRAEYGPAMGQLFRDQGRDAWNEAGQWGLMKLWLRVLPDLVRTALAEQMASFNPVKSLSHRFAGLFRAPSPWPAFFTAAAAVFLLTFSVGVISAFLSPEMYASTARVRVAPELIWPVDPMAVAPGAHPIFFGTDFIPRVKPTLQPIRPTSAIIQAASEIMESDVVLTRVVKQLNLAVKWGQKYNGGKDLTDFEAVRMLRHGMMFISPVPEIYSTGITVYDLVGITVYDLVGITVYDENKNEAAQIANAVVESCRDITIYDENKKEVLQIPRAPRIKGVPVKAYASLRVQIIDPAEPGHAPVRPNKPLNIVIGIIGGGILGLVAGALMALIWLIARAVMRARLA
jgi:hypothetical protein